MRLNLRGFLVLFAQRNDCLLSVLLDGIGQRGQLVRNMAATAEDNANIGVLDRRLDLLMMICTSLIIRRLVDAEGRGVVDSGLVGHALGDGFGLLGDLGVRIRDFAVDDDELDRLRRFGRFLRLHILIL